MTITKTREDSKLILKNMPKAVQAACDKIFVAGADFGGAIMQTNEKDRAFRLALLDASNAFGKPGKDSPYKGFGAFACAVFGFTSESAVTNAVKVAEHIDIPNVPKLSAWYSTTTLYELRDVPAETLAEDIKSGKLHAGMTQKELRDYNKTHRLDSGKPVVVPMFDAHFTTSERESFSETLSLEDIRGKLFAIVGCEDNKDDRIGTFNPHAELTRVTGKGNNKTVTGKGLMIAYNGRFASAVYFPTESAKTAKSGENASTIAAQNATIAKLMAELEALKAAQNK